MHGKTKGRIHPVNDNGCLSGMGQGKGNGNDNTGKKQIGKPVPDALLVLEVSCLMRQYAQQFLFAVFVDEVIRNAEGSVPQDLQQEGILCRGLF